MEYRGQVSGRDAIQGVRKRLDEFFLARQHDRRPDLVPCYRPQLLAALLAEQMRQEQILHRRDVFQERDGRGGIVRLRAERQGLQRRQPLSQVGCVS